MDNHGFTSRRSTVHSTKGVVCSTQPLATSAGLQVLEKGGNAVMAAVAVSACLSMLEPHMTGPGGDMFALFYSAKDGSVQGINGCGRSASAMSIEAVRAKGVEGTTIPETSALAVDVPGAVAGWIDAIEKWGNGKLTLGEILQPAIDLAKNGAPISSISSYLWSGGVQKLKTSPNGYELLTPDGDYPRPGEIVVNPGLAQTLSRIAKEGKAGFYSGKTADAIIDVLQAQGSLMTHEDLLAHKSEFVEPIKLSYGDLDVWEIPPNGQGLVALLGLGIIQELEKSGKVDVASMDHNSAEYIHVVTEALKLAFHDADEYICDQDFGSIPLAELLSEKYLASRAAEIDLGSANSSMSHGVPSRIHSSDTCYFTVADAEGNACSFINSVFGLFGSKLVPQGCGFALNNRGRNFSLVPGRANSLAGSKRPYHTIIPAMVTRQGSLFASYGVMGGFMQPQGHLQVLLNLVEFGFDPQVALDAPRICLCPESTENTATGSIGPVAAPTVIAVEDGVPEEELEKLRAMGHLVKRVTGNSRELFGRGQIIRETKDKRTGRRVYTAGSDQRGDGAAVAQV